VPFAGRSGGPEVGRGQRAVADDDPLNHDGWVDHADLQCVLSGRPAGPRSRCRGGGEDAPALGWTGECCWVNPLERNPTRRSAHLLRIECAGAVLIDGSDSSLENGRDSFGRSTGPKDASAQCGARGCGLSPSERPRGESLKGKQNHEHQHRDYLGRPRSPSLRRWRRLLLEKSTLAHRPVCPEWRAQFARFLWLYPRVRGRSLCTRLLLRSQACLAALQGAQRHRDCIGPSPGL